MFFFGLCSPIKGTEGIVVIPKVKPYTYKNKHLYKLSKDSHHGFQWKIGSWYIKTAKGTLGCRTLPAPPQSYLSWQHLGCRLDFCGCWHPWHWTNIRLKSGCQAIGFLGQPTPQTIMWLVARCEIHEFCLQLWSSHIGSTWIKLVPIDYGDQHIFENRTHIWILVIIVSPLGAPDSVFHILYWYIFKLYSYDWGYL